MSKKICHITSVHPRHDVRILTKECLTLAQSGFIVDLIVADGKPDEVYCENNVSVNIYSVAKPHSRLKRIYQTPKKIFARILELQPAIIHFHDPELMFLALKLTRLGYKVIYDVHEDVPKQIQSKHWLPKMVRPLIAKIVSSLESFVATKIAAVAAATPIIAKRFLNYNKNTITIENYPKLQEINHSKFSDISWSSRSDFICYIGSISKNRGIVQIIESLTYSNCHLQLAGIFSGDSSLQELSGYSGFKNVSYCGVLGRSDVMNLLGKVKVGLVTLLPTPSYVEALPIKMFEYMLAGIPVVASDFPLWHEIIEKYNCGRLVDPNDAKEIAKACTELFANQKLAEQMGKNGQKAVLEVFNFEIVAPKLVRLYSQLI